MRYYSAGAEINDHAVSRPCAPFWSALLFLVVSMASASCDKEAEKPLKTAAVERGDLEITVSAPGKLVPSDVRTIKSRAAGEVDALLVKEGDTVSKGDLLLRLDPKVERTRLSRALSEQRAAKAGVEQARVRLNQARDDFMRQKRLFKEGMISQSKFEAGRRSLSIARSELDIAESRAQASAEDVEEARNRLSYTEIVSPMKGTVLDLSVAAGQVVSSGTTGLDTGTPLLTIADLSRLKVKARVEETDVASVAAGQKVRIELDSFPDETFPGKVIDIAPEATDEGALTVVEVEIVLEDAKGAALRPGMSATVEIVTFAKEDVLLAPVTSLRTRDNEKGTVLIKSGTTSWQPVETGPGDWEKVIIKDGLTAGDRVVLPP